MATRNPYSISTGQMYGMYSCGLKWWMRNPGKPPGPRSSDLHREWFMSLRFTGIHNRHTTYFGFNDDMIEEAILGPRGYHTMVWSSALDILVDSKVLVFDVRERSHYNANYSLTADEFRADWTPHADLGFLGSPSEAEWMEPSVRLGTQLEWAEHALSGTPGVRVLLVRNHTHRVPFGSTRPPDDWKSASLLLFEPWQWAAFHATLHSLCAPYLAGVPAF